MPKCKQKLIQDGAIAVPRTCEICGKGKCWWSYRVSEEFEHYRTSPKDPLYLMMKVIEEASEVMQVYSKIVRFGYSSYHPNDPNKTTNLELLRNEIRDLEYAIQEWSEWDKNLTEG